jgi:uncharacterized SAM-binding protein YcdF (DUF218 family)
MVQCPSRLSGRQQIACCGARLYRAGKVFHGLAAGGRLPWIGDGGRRPRRCAIGSRNRGPKEAIVLEGGSLNTRENAQGAAQVIRERSWGRVLLVASAAHMRRAVEAFRAVGIEVVAPPTD